MSTSSDSATELANEAAIQPGQVGIRHLLGGMTVVAVIAAISAASVRGLPALRAWEVAAHWVAVAAIAAAMFYGNALRRRHNRQRAGRVLLRAMRRPLTSRQRTVLSWIWTAAVIADGVFVSVVVVPQIGLWDLWKANPYMFVMLLAGQGALWGYCLDHWLANVYWIEFREHGVLTHGKYYPWPSVTRIGWSPAHPNRLVILHGGFFEEMTIDPQAHAAVTKLLVQISRHSRVG